MAFNQDKFLRLRNEFPRFVYEGFEYGLSEGDFVATFRFSCGEYMFMPKHTFKHKDFYSFNHLSNEQIELLLFNIGMIELVSYWKAFCSPRIVIKGWCLEKEELAFWRKIYFYGLGEFFFVNGITTDINSFVEFECEGKRVMKACDFDLEDRYIVPIGGGKDSVVSLDLLYGAGRDISPFIINPRGASLDCCSQAGLVREEISEDRREIDPLLLELNELGFLNGHTPFSAMLAFTSLLTAAFTRRKHIALSNESSANESTVIGENINHQYSKSLEFENDFRSYVSKFVCSDFNYFSFLRPLSELHIAKLFSELDYKYVFKSCNVGSKQDIWCGHCPKCLFAFVILSPFLEKDVLKRIFGKNLFEDAELSTYLLQLCGMEEQKPFECVGTINEVNTALAMRVMREKPSEKEILLQRWLELPIAKNYADKVAKECAYGTPDKLFALADEHNLLPRDFEIFSNPYSAIKKAALRRMLCKEKIAILGFGREGKSSLKMLESISVNHDIIVADGNEETIRQNNESENIHDGTCFRLLKEENLKDRTCFLKTPGIACKSIPFIPKERISSQSDLFLRLFHAQTIGISGTKGKSTTSSLIYKIIKDQNPNVILAGNIGIPLFDIIDKIDGRTIIVAELSAHQLQFIKNAPHISVLLNLYEEHLDHFDSFSQYQHAKFNLASKQNKGDYFVCNADDERIQTLLCENEPKSEIIKFGKGDYKYAEPEYLKGEHNKANAMAALRVAEILGLNKEKAVQSIVDFHPLAHRLQCIGTIHGVTYYNDSISTIPEATIAALRALKKVDTLILGGKDRGIDYSVFAKELPEFAVRNIAFTGAAGRRIASVLSAAGLKYNSIISDDYKNIVSWCADKTEKGMICLLSPAASSYDMFLNFEHRGKVFTDLVNGLNERGK